MDYLNKLRFCQRKYAVMVDITQIFHQVRVLPSDCLNQVLRKAPFDHYKKFNVHVTNAVLGKFYMDDYLDSFDNLDKVITTIHDVTSFLTIGFFNLATFISSNRITLKTCHAKFCCQRLLIQTLKNYPDTGCQ